MKIGIHQLTTEIPTETMVSCRSLAPPHRSCMDW